MKKQIFLFLTIALVVCSALFANAAENSLRHNSNYDVSDYVYENLDDYTDTHHYVHDETLDPVCEKNQSDEISGILDTDKVIDLYYGYDNVITIKYFDAYTKEELTGEDYIADKSNLNIVLEHNENYDISELIDNIYSGYSFIKEVSYSLENVGATGVLEQDFTVSVYLGYTHKIIVRYHDKYTGEVIHEELIDEAEALSAYDVNYAEVPNIVYNETNYSIDGSEGDSLSGILDADKLSTLNYAYTNSIVVKYKDAATNTEIFSENVEEQEHLTEYNAEDKTNVNINGYKKLTETTGDLTIGELDTDKEITVWYEKTAEKGNKLTGDNSNIVLTITISVLALTVIAVIFVIEAKQKKKRA